MVLVHSQVEFGHRQWDKAILVGWKPVPLHQEIERGDGKRQPCLNILSDPVTDLFQVADGGHHGQDGFNDHAFVPLPARAQLKVGRIAVGGMKAAIPQDHAVLSNRLNQGMKPGIMRIGRCPRPTDHQPQSIKQRTQFDPDNPAMIGFTLGTDLGRATALPHGMDQFNPIAIDHAQQRRLRQKPVGPGPVGLEQPKQPSPLRQVGKQGFIVSPQPAIKRPVAAPFEGVQQPQRDNLARPQPALAVFRNRGHSIIHLTKQRGDKINCGHGFAL